MSTIHRKEYRCSVCGKASEFMVLGSTNTFCGAPDLDLRPPEMERSTMPLWIHRCPGCGYVSENVDDLTTVTAEYLASEEYHSCDGIEFKSDLAGEFYQFYMISTVDKNVRDAFYALVHAAWACDDEGDTENAVRCRRLALPLADEFIRMNEGNRANMDTIGLMKADLMRRAGLFDEVVSGYAGVTYDNDLMDRILAFEIELSERKDDACYRFSDIPGGVNGTGE